ncbi:MAG: M20 family metallo-hydrolase [Hyphomicrobiales bacterium]|nr:M20 family metallo-hydrolase [Hyphomicrobiales bacterium]
MIEAPAGKIDVDRFRARHEAMAAIGATGRGGIDRQALTEAEIEARALVIGWARLRGYALSVDPIGNLFIRRPGRGGGFAPVLAGSHLDSQPNGGNFDGVYGVLAALEVLEALDDGGIETDRPIEVVVWTNEEGARFQPTTMGSAVYVGALPLQQALAVRGRDGVTVSEALACMLRKLPHCADRALATPLHAYVEAHIEQGPILESARRKIGVVLGIQGLRQYAVTVEGTEAHAGTTPRLRRRDAFVAARRIAAEFDRVATDAKDIARLTIGRFDVSPGTTNTIPGKVTMTVDVRHPDEHELERLDRAIREICRERAQPCSASIETLLTSRTVNFATSVVDAVREEAARLGHGALDIMSGATHDAAFLARLCPTGMIFVPCRDGVSHNEAEYTSLENMVAGVEVLAGVVQRLSRREAGVGA